jgi:sugar phosphate isomerase/epimerase
MEYGLSTRLFADERLNSHVLDRVLAAGFRQIAISAGHQHLDYRDKNHIRDVAQWFADHGVRLHSLHAPTFTDAERGRSGGLEISVAYLERRLRIDSMDEIKYALEVAELLPFPYLVLHLGRPEETYDLRKLDAAFTSIEHLRIFAKQRGVSLLIENTPNELSTPERLVQFLEYTRLEDVKICFDTGHAHLAGGVEPAFATLKSLIAAAHLDDNHGTKDEHLVPFDGDIDWSATVRSLQSAQTPVTALLEPHSSGDASSILTRLRDIVERLKQLGQAEASAAAPGAA